jgi:hypothetical protein
MKTEHFRLDSSIEDLQCETAPLIIWTTLEGDGSPDMSELLYQFYFEN